MNLKTKSIFIRLAVAILTITVIFWLFSSIIVVRYLKNNIVKEFTSSNKKILASLARQSLNDLRFYDFYQLRRTLHDFYDETYMDYFALYTVDMKPFATYPAVQFPSDVIEFIENQIKENAQNESSTKFLNILGQRRFHFQHQVKDENGQVLGYIFMGGRTAWLDSMIKDQIFYFILLGLFVLIIEVCVLIYFARRFTKPIWQLTNMLKLVQEKEPDELISTVLAQPELMATCSEVEVFDSVVRKLLKTIQEYQRKEMHLSIQATLGRLTSHFAHDIRTPLASIGHYLNSRRPNSNVENDEILKFENIKKQLKKMDQMADELTSYTKAKEVNISSVDIGHLLDEVKKDMSEIAESKNVNIGINCITNFNASIDFGRIVRVLNNIVLNSIHAIPRKKGEVNITAENQNGDLIIRVKDNGCGIRPEHMPRLFDSSFTYGKVKGTGLGLAYCKNVIDAHGGEIEVESRLNEGTVFTIKIPKCIVSPINIRSEPVNPCPAEWRGATHQPLPRRMAGCNLSRQWLIVDDAQTFREQWRDIIAGQSLPPPIEMSSAEEFHKSRLDVTKLCGAIVDYNFDNSNMTGIDIIEFLKNKGLQRVYLCTANYNDAKIIKEANRLKISDSIIPKPIPDKSSELIKRIFQPS